MQQQVLSDRYELERLIGSGAAAEVWLARDRALGREVAVKILHRHVAADPVFVERFRREAQAAARLNNPNIVAIYDWGEVAPGETGRPSGYYIVMEYVRGENLKERLVRTGPLPEGEALGIAAEVAAALEVAHRQGIVHRDVKPHNILIGEDGRVHVADFGIARAQGASQLTQTGAVAGTAHYLSPEQAQRLPLDGRSDLYGLGIVLYEMLTGRVPFEGDSLVEVALRHMREEPTPVRLLRPEISAGTEAIVRKALAKDPADRFPDAQTMRAALLAERDRVAQPDPVPADDPTVIVERRPIPTRERRRSETVPVVRRNSSRMATEKGGRSLYPWLLAVPLLLLLAAGGVALAHLPGGTPKTAAAPTATSIAGTGSKAKHRATPVSGKHPVAGSAHPTAHPGHPTPRPAHPTAQPKPVIAQAPAPTATSAPATGGSGGTSGSSGSSGGVAAAPPKAAATAVIPAPSSQGAATPGDAVISFYTDVATGQYGPAQSLWTASLAQSCPPSSCISGRFSGTTAIAVHSAVVTAQTADSATVAVDLTETQASGAVYHWVGTWGLVHGTSGWLLNAPALHQAGNASTAGQETNPGKGHGNGKAKGHGNG